MEKVVNPYGVKVRGIDGERFQDIAEIRLGGMPCDAPGGEIQRAAVDIRQGDARCVRGEAAMIEKVAGSDTDIEMVCRDVFVVVLDQPLRRAVPNEMV